MEYAEIVKLRSQAEAGADPDLYEMAAAEFEALGMLTAAERCRERARHYRDQQLKVFAQFDITPALQHVER